jgi:hypothetical protein
MTPFSSYPYSRLRDGGEASLKRRPWTGKWFMCIIKGGFFLQIVPVDNYDLLTSMSTPNLTSFTV